VQESVYIAIDQCGDGVCQRDKRFCEDAYNAYSHSSDDFNAAHKPILFYRYIYGVVVKVYFAVPETVVYGSAFERSAKNFSSVFYVKAVRVGDFRCAGRLPIVTCV
jgi:hypothetical protein